jgi:hypothetical protein
LLIPEFLLVCESCDVLDIDGVESVDNLDLGDDTNGLFDFVLGLRSLGACLFNELDELTDFLALACDLLVHAFDILFVIIALLALVLHC